MLQVSFHKLDDGSWGLRFAQNAPGAVKVPYGEQVTVTKRNGGSSRVTVGSRVDGWNGGRVVITRIARDTAGRDAAEAARQRQLAALRESIAEDNARRDAMENAEAAMVNAEMAADCGGCEHCDGEGGCNLADEYGDVPERRHGCDGCNGSGIYHGAGRMENGVFIGFTGKCYRCGGKGYQTPADVRRNTYYDNRVRRVYA